ncbi:MAG: hypothetical protein AAF512_00335 [Pseudomonadota bacterium]
MPDNVSQEQQDYLAAIHRAWLGEVYGQAFFESVANNTNDPERAETWKLLAHLEEVTGRRMLTLVEANSLSAELPESLEQMVEMGVAYAKMPHQQAMQEMKPTIDSAVERYEALLDVAPEHEQTAVQFLVDHERALASFVDSELSGQSKSALDDVRALLSGL